MAKKKIESTSDMSGGAAVISALRDSLAGIVNLKDGYMLSSNSVMIGLPVPSIAMQWLLNSNVFPLSKVHEITGEEGTRKSTFMYELMRWHLESGGQVVLVETEQKDNSFLRNAVLKYNTEHINRTIVVPTVVYDEWVKSLNKALAAYSDAADKGMECPVLFAVDSVTAAATSQDMEDVADDKLGVASSGYPRMAKRLTNDIKCFVAKLRQYPFTLAFTNHYKPSMDAFSSQGSRPGGKGLKFAETFSIQIKAGGKGAITEYADGTVKVQLNFVTLKAAIGKGGRQISVVLYYTTEANPNYIEDSDNPYNSEDRLNVSFDWGETDIQFLQRYCDGSIGNVSAERRKEVADLVGLNFVKGGRGQMNVWSLPLGISSDSPVSLHDAGMLLMADNNLVRKLQHALDIQRSVAYNQDISFYQQLVTARKLSDAALCAGQELAEADNMDVL